eukprot:776288-Karenia_brevis.AAC.1
MLGGDFNFAKPGEAEYKVDGLQRHPEIAEPLTGQNRKIQSVMDKMPEISCRHPTHFDHSGLKETKTDRLFTSIPPWAI